jgi:hypothetical protein
VSAAAPERQNPAGLTWCPTCKEETVPMRRGTCGWCNGDTQPLKAPETLAQRAKLATEAQRSALQAMDAGEPQRLALAPVKTGPVEAAETATGVADGLTDGGSTGDAGAPALTHVEVDRASTNPYGLRKAGRGYAWTLDTAIEAVRAFAREHGRPPKGDDWDAEAVAARLPSHATAHRLFGGTAALVEAAGFERPKWGGSVRAPRAEVAAEPCSTGERAASAGDEEQAGVVDPDGTGSAAIREAIGEDAGAVTPSSPRAPASSAAEPEAPPVAPPGLLSPRVRAAAAELLRAIAATLEEPTP